VDVDVSVLVWAEVGTAVSVTESVTVAAGAPPPTGPLCFWPDPPDPLPLLADEVVVVVVVVDVVLGALLVPLPLHATVNKPMPIAAMIPTAADDRR
jgi:hypothetical protein